MHVVANALLTHRNKIIDNLRTQPFAPSVQMHSVPRTGALFPDQQELSDDEDSDDSSAPPSPPLPRAAGDPDALTARVFEYDAEWALPVVDDWTYARVRDAVQERWLAFAHGDAPWRADRAFVLGPEGEAGERSMGIFPGRRRVEVWKDALEPLGMHLAQKIGIELSNGPTMA